MTGLTATARALLARVVALPVLLAVTFGTAAAVLVSMPATASAAPRAHAVLPQVPGDCKGDAPMPGSPYGHLSVKPVVTSTGDPFADPHVSLESVYGTTYRWWTYDNGCGVGSDLVPGVGTRLAEVEMELGAVVPNWGHYLMDSLIDPSAWIGIVDPVVADVTQAVTESVWTPWLIVVLTLVALVVMWRARGGRLAGSISAILWAGLVLIFCTWAMNYPAEALRLVDRGIQTTIADVSTGFADADQPGPQVAPDYGSAGETGRWWMAEPADLHTRNKALAATDRLYDSLVRNTVYRAWAQGAFGDPEGPTAKEYGPALFKATHFTFAEYDTYQKDPSGAGKKLIDDKAKAFKDIADKVSKADPVAYRTFTGNEWGNRLTAATLNLVTVLAAGLFLIVSAVCVLIAYVIVRLFVPLSPAVGILFMLDSVRSTAMTFMRRAAAPVVMGPVFLVVGLIVLRYNSTIMSADLNPVVKLLLILAVSMLAWKLLKPMDVIKPTSTPRVPGFDMLKQYVVARQGTHDGAMAAADDIEDEEAERLRHTGSTYRRYGEPVYQGAAAGAATAPIFVRSEPMALATAAPPAQADNFALPAGPPPGAGPRSRETFAPRTFGSDSGGVLTATPPAEDTGYGSGAARSGLITLSPPGSTSEPGRPLTVAGDGGSGRAETWTPVDRPQESGGATAWAHGSGRAQPTIGRSSASDVADDPAELRGSTGSTGSTAGGVGRGNGPRDLGQDDPAPHDGHTGHGGTDGGRRGPSSVAPANLTIDEDGREVYVIYHPDGEQTFDREDDR